MEIVYCGKEHTIKQQHNTLQTIKIEESFPGFGFFPKPGRSVGLLHDNLQKEKGVTKLVSIGIMNTAMTFRATDGANFSMHELIGVLQKELPNAFVEGGGHKNADHLLACLGANFPFFLPCHKAQ